MGRERFVSDHGNQDTINLKQAGLITRIRQIKPDLIIGIGGGSSLNAGNALALLATNDGEIKKYEGKEKPHIRKQYRRFCLW